MHHRKKRLVDLLRVTNPSSAVNSTITLDFNAADLAGSGLVLTCCKLGCENNPEKLQKAGFPHMQTQACTCIPSGTSPHADAAQPVSVTLHSGAPPPSPGDRHQGILSGNSGAGRIRTQGRVRLETTRGSTADSTPDAEVREDVTRKTRKRRRTTAAVWKNPSPMMRCKRGGEGLKHPKHCGREASTTVPQFPAINPSRSPFPASAPGSIQTRVKSVEKLPSPIRISPL